MQELFENWRKFRKESKSLLQEQKHIVGLDGHELDLTDDPRKIGREQWKRDAVELLEDNFDTSKLKSVLVDTDALGNEGRYYRWRPRVIHVTAGGETIILAGTEIGASGEYSGEFYGAYKGGQKAPDADDIGHYIKQNLHWNIDELNQSQRNQIQYAIDELVDELIEDLKVKIDKRIAALDKEMDDIYIRRAGAEGDEYFFHGPGGQEAWEATKEQRQQRKHLRATLQNITVYQADRVVTRQTLRELYRASANYYKSSWEKYAAGVRAEIDKPAFEPDEPTVWEPGEGEAYRGENRPLSMDLDFERLKKKVNIDVVDGVYAQILKDPDAALDRIILSKGGGAFKHAAVPSPGDRWSRRGDLVVSRDEVEAALIKRKMKKLEARRGGRPEIVDISDPRVESSEGIRWGRPSKRLGDTRIIADDDLIREAKKIGWHRLTPEQQKKVIARLAAIELDAMYNITGTKKPIAKTIHAFETYTESVREIGEELGTISEESARQADILRKTKVVRGTGFKALLKKIPFLGVLITAVAFPYGEAKAAFRRGVEREAGLREKYKGVEDPQAELIELLLIESLRAGDPGFELGVMAASSATFAVDVIKGGLLPWLLGRRTKPGLDPQTEKYNIEDYPMEYRKEKPEQEEIGPTLPMNENNKHSRKLKIIINTK
jgi:hypothetical protein